MSCAARLNYAALAIGSQTLGVLSALVPIGGHCARWPLRRSCSKPEWVAIVVISAGVAVASLPVTRAPRVLRATRGVVPLGQSTVT